MSDFPLFGFPCVSSEFPPVLRLEVCQEACSPLPGGCGLFHLNDPAAGSNSFFSLPLQISILLRLNWLLLETFLALPRAFPFSPPPRASGRLDREAVTLQALGGER